LNCLYYPPKIELQNQSGYERRGVSPNLSLVGGICVRAIFFGIQTAFGLGIAAIVKLEVLLGGIAIAMLVGILSGLYPAMKASNISPVEAVTYEEYE
jgi:putative ABC transport system permease protein